MYASLDSLYSEMRGYDNEKNKWKVLSASIEDQLTSSRTMLLTLETTARGYDSSVPSETLDIEIQRVQNLTDLLYTQYRISEAVAAYADLDSSARATDAQTAQEFKLADQALTEAEQIYREAIESLSNLSAALGTGQTALTEARRIMDEAMTLMVQAQNAYETSFAVVSKQQSRRDRAG